MSEPSKRDKEDFDRVCKAVNELAEHFDTVQIFVTRHESNDIGTVSMNRGAGSWHARFGQVREWLVKQEERSRFHARNEAQAEEDEQR